MNRRGFITNLFRVSAAVVIAPVMVAEVLPTTVPKGPIGIWEQMKMANVLHYNQFSMEDLEKIVYELSEHIYQPRKFVIWTNPRNRALLERAMNFNLNNY